MEQEQHNRHSIYGKRILIIGGTSGIGFAVARAASAEGAQIIIASANTKRVNEAKEKIGNGCGGYTVNVSLENELQAMFQQIGSFDHLVYTAGENIVLNLLEQTQLPQAKDYFTIRYWGAVAAVKHGAAYINKGGSIVLTSGIASQRPGAGWWLGASICSAMEGFAKGMSIELAPVRVNIVSPGVVKTNLWASMTQDERDALFEATEKKLPVNFVAEADDLAQTYLYCMKQPYTTGQIITVDGGAVLV